MTTPGGVPNLPQGALTLDTLATNLQDMSPAAMKSRAADRFPSIFNNSTGMDPALDITPFGILTSIWAQFNSLVANADPADIDGPEDLPQLLLDYIEGLPVIGQLVGLLEAILGTYDGDDPTLLTIQEIFGPIRALVDVFADLDSSSPEAFLQSLLDALITLLISLPPLLYDLATALVESGVGLLGVDSPLNAELLFNMVNPNILGDLPFTHIGENVVNLLANPSFEGAASVSGSGLWFWDNTVGRTTLGSLYTTASGAERQMVSNAIRVSKGQQLNLSVFTQWSGLTYTGTAPIKLQVEKLLNYDHLGADTLSIPALTSPATNQATWLQVGSDYTVPAGVDMICLKLLVASTATAGTVRFDDGDVHKLGSDATFIPFWNVLGVGGPANLGSSITSTWDQLVSGLVGVLGTGASLPDLFSVPYDVSSWASLGRMGWDILGIRNNKTIDSGLLATSGSNFGLSRVAMAASAPTINVTQSVSAIAFMRMEQSTDKKVVSWLGSGTTNISACYVNIWQMDPATGIMTLVHRSSNIVGNLSASMNWVIYEMPSALPTEASDVFGIEITVQGIGTHQVAGTTTWIPNHPNVYPKTYAATRNSGTGTPTLGDTIAAASVGYSTNIPWVEWGIDAGVSTSVHSDDPHTITDVGASTLPIPTWANYADVVAVGAGGAGGPGSFYGLPGPYGGSAGTWATGTWTRGTDFTGATIISINVGAGGDPAATTNGAATVVSITGHTVTAAGGTYGGSGFQGGTGAGNQVYNSVTYVGGGQQNSEPGAGVVPGGGGGSGSNFVGGSGGAGAIGRAWIVFRQ